MIHYKKISYIIVMKGTRSRNLIFWVRNGFKSSVEKKLVFGYLQAILLCIVGNLAGGAFVAVAVCVSDM